jgi:ABC-type microcin C transport system duplicated ATPase subunit YejF
VSVEKKTAETVLKVQRLEKYFPVKASYFSNQSLILKAVDNINFDLKKGETLGLVASPDAGRPPWVDRSSGCTNRMKVAYI